MRILLILVIVLTLLCGVGANAADKSEREINIYNGAPVSLSDITLGSWGSGKAVETKDKILTGSNSIKITSQSLYSGARIDFNQPIALTVDGIKKNHYMQFAFFFDDVQVINPAAGTNSWEDIDPYTTPKATKVRFRFVFDNDLTVSAEEPTNPLDVDDNWVRIAVPLVKLNLPDEGKGLHLKRLIITFDGPGTITAPATMYLGEVKIVTDSMPIQVDSLGSQVVMCYDDVFLVPAATGGISSLKYSWDFDGSNGIQEDLVGSVGRVAYKKGGDFIVTVTVSDVDGVKEPAQATGTISVTD